MHPLARAIRANATYVMAAILETLEQQSLTRQSALLSDLGDGNTPLHFAAKLGQPSCAEVLIQSAGNSWQDLIGARNAAGQLPHELAAPDSPLAGRLRELHEHALRASHAAAKSARVSRAISAVLALAGIVAFAFAWHAVAAATGVASVACLLGAPLLVTLGTFLTTFAGSALFMYSTLFRAVIAGLAGTIIALLVRSNIIVALLAGLATATMFYCSVVSFVVRCTGCAVITVAVIMLQRIIGKNGPAYSGTATIAIVATTMAWGMYTGYL